jgi:hypothetical protein
MQLQPQGTNDLQDGVEAGASISGERLVQALSGQAGLSCNLRHSFGSGDVPKGLGDEGGILGCLFKASFKVGGHFLGGSEVFGNVVAGGSSFDLLGPAPEC